MTSIILDGKQKNCQVRVRLVPDISAAAFRNGLTKEIILWYRLRSLNTTGSGYIHEDKALDGLESYYGTGRRTAFRYLAKGEGCFWERLASKRGSVIKIYGLKIVCEYLGTSLINLSRFYDVQSADFQGLKPARLRMWESIHKPRHIRANPISRLTLQDYTSVPKTTQLRYDKESHVRRTVNHSQDAKFHRLPNIYHHSQDPGNKGMLPKVRRLLKSFYPEGALEERRYFGNLLSRNKAIRVGMKVCDFSWILIRSNQRQIKGRMEWRQCFTMV